MCGRRYLVAGKPYFSRRQEYKSVGEDQSGDNDGHHGYRTEEERGRRSAERIDYEIEEGKGMSKKAGKRMRRSLWKEERKRDTDLSPRVQL
jgi:hypothetical protein